MLDLNFQIISPAFDVILITILVYAVSYRFFAYYYKNQLNKIALMDFQIFVILGVFFFLNYKGTEIDFFGFFKVDWFLYFVAMSVLIESFFMVFYAKKIGFIKKNIIKSVNKKAFLLDQKDVVVQMEKIKKELKSKLNELNSLSELEKDAGVQKRISEIKYELLKIGEEIKKQKSKGKKKQKS